MTSSKNTAAAIYERINLRRNSQSAPAPDLRVQARDDGQDGDRTPDALPLVTVTGPVLRAPLATMAGDSDTGDSDTFPRSATMRAILKHPLLTLGVGLPAAGLLLTSARSRRVLALALQIGASPELHHLLQLSRAATQPADQPSPEQPPVPIQKHDR